MNRASKLKTGLALLAVSASLLLSACKDSPADLIRSARDYQAKNDHQAAIIQLKNVLQAQPENGEARLLLAQSSLAVGDSVTAEKEFRKALEYGQPAATVVPLIAATMLDNGGAEKVVSEFGAKKLDDPKADAELRARVGEAYLRMGNLKDGAASFAAALAADPRNARAQLGQARLEASEGKLDEASTAVERVIAASPASVDALVLSAELKLAHGDRAGARAALERAVELSPTTPGLRVQLVSLLVTDGQFDAAAAQIASARAARVQDLRLQYLEAVVAMGKKDLPKARELSEQILKRAPGHVQTMVLLGSIEMQEKKFGQAESVLQSAVSLAPNYMVARLMLARSYMSSGQPARALEAIRPLLDSGPQTNPAVSMLAGEVLMANGDLKQASAYFEAASKSKAGEAMARTRLSQIAMAKGDLEGGVRELESVTSDETAPLQADMALLAGYVRQGETAKALDVARALVKKRPNDPVVHHALGAVQLTRKDFAAARAAFSKAVELNPVFMPSVSALAQLDLMADKPADARARFDAVLAKDPKNETALLGLADVMARTKAPPAEIAAVIQRAIAAQPQSVNARLALISLHLRNRDARAAVTAAQEAATVLGQDPRILDALGQAQMAAGDTNQAIETFNRMAALQPPSAVPLVRLSSLYMNGKQPEKAVQVLLRAQKIAPQDATVVRELALAYLAMGKTDEAVKQTRALQASAPTSVSGYMLEGDVYATVKQWPAAEKAYRQGLKVDPKSELTGVKLHSVLVASNKNAEADALARKWMADSPKSVVFRTYLAERALSTRDLKTAVVHYEALTALQPENVVALNNFAWALGQLQDPRAVTYAERALKLAPDSPAVLDTLGVILTAKGDAAKGSEYLSRAVALAPDRHDIRLNYAKALLKAGRKDDARKELTRLEAVSQDFAGKSEVAGLLKQ